MFEKVLVLGGRLGGLPVALSDPAVAAGMGKLFEILRVLGEDTLSKSK
jgi:uncharacterized protein YjgD (DUF1641 family)